ncbi:E3 ubiquitin-protein ligase RNF43 isoform X1 [Lates japonicus]
MTVPQRRLAGLWPWLLMAALQVVLGQPGLESERPALRAVIKVTLLKNEPTGKPITLEGVFVGGSAGHAEGKLMQVLNAALNRPRTLSAHFPRLALSTAVWERGMGGRRGALRENIKESPVPNVSWDD